MKKILVIEDTNFIRNETCRILEYEGFKTFPAENGQVGIEKAKEHRPDLILCDIMMPVMDGYGVIDKLQQDPETATIPFVFLTAMASKENVRDGMLKGADDYLTKPFTVEQLITTVNTRLSKQEVIANKTRKKVEELRSQIGVSFPHELKTPLTSILGYTDYLLNYVDDMEKPEIKEQVRFINTAGKRLYRTIENFLAYTEVNLIEKDAQKLQKWLRSETHSPINLIKTACMEIAERYGRLNDLEIARAASDDVKLKIPETNLKKIVEEIVDNGFKFTEPGTRVRVECGKAGARRFLLQISDAGKGLTTGQIKNIGAYNQFDRTENEQQGSGLGLVITRKMVELQGGLFKVESESNKGLTVTISLSIT